MKSCTFSKENTTLKFTGKAFIAVFILFIFFIIAHQVQAATYYIDYENGNDANDGLFPSSPKQHHPFDKDNGWSIANNTGHTIYLKKGVIYRGQLNASNRNGASASDRLTTTYTDSFGSGNPPELRGASIYTGWTQDATYTNTYKKSFSAVAASILFQNNSLFGIWEDDAYMIGVSSLADCNNIPGTFYFDGSDYIYIHTFETDNPDDYTIEVTDKDYGVKQWGSQYITFQGITFSRYKKAGAYTLTAAGDTAFNYCIFRDNDTGILANGDTDLNHITVIRNLWRGIYVNASTADVVLKDSLIAANAINSAGEGVLQSQGSLKYSNNNIVGNGTKIYKDVVGTVVDLGGNISQTPKMDSDFSNYSYLNFSIDDASNSAYVYNLAQAFNMVTGGNVPLTHYVSNIGYCNTSLLSTYSKPAHDMYGVEIANHTEGHLNMDLTSIAIKFRYTGANSSATVEVTASNIIFRDSVTTTKSLSNADLTFNLPSGWEINYNTGSTLDLDILGVLAETNAKNTWVDMNVTIEDYYREEVTEQSNCIEAVIGVRPVSFAYPNGKYSAISDTYLANRGIESARTTQANYWLEHFSTHKVDLYYLGNINIVDYPINSLSRAVEWGHNIATKLNLFPVFLTPHWYSNSNVDINYADDFLQTILDNTNAKVDTMRANVDHIKLNGIASSDGFTYARKIPINTLNLGSECGVTKEILWYQDADGDGYGNPAFTVQQCTQPVGYVTNNTDCNDNNASINPGATTELCNGVDDNCNGQIDEGLPSNTYYRDADGDAYGNQAVSTQACVAPAGYVTDDTDCNDNDPKEHPNQIWYLDADGDGYSDGTTNTTSCTRPLGYKVASELIATSGDCNDATPAINPETYWHPDFDGDGYGNPTISLQQCIQPVGYILDNTDCNDNDANVYPGWPPARIARITPLYFTTLQAAYDAAEDLETIQVQTVSFTENLIIDINKSVILDGGYNDCSYIINTGKTTINGNVTISDGIVTIENFILQ